MTDNRHIGSFLDDVLGNDDVVEVHWDDIERFMIKSRVGKYEGTISRLLKLIAEKKEAK